MDLKTENNPKSHSVRKNPCLKSAMDKLYTDREKTGDIKFLIDSKVVHAHRCVLAALSPRYEAQFYGGLAEKDIIAVKDVSPAAFKEFLQFFYTDEVTLTLNNIEDVLNLAKQSLVDELVTECINFLIDVAGMDKIRWCYQLALRYESKSLEQFCIDRIGADIKTAFQTTDLLNCDRDMLCHILDQDSLNCKEIDVFDACISWAQAKCEQDGLDVADKTNLREALGEALFKIRFCSMKVEEFAAANREYSGLLSAQESIDVFNAIVLKANGVKSNIFGDKNSKPRGCTDDLETQTSLQCSFGKGQRIKFTASNDSDYIVFYCDKAIKLNGFIICNRIDDEIKVEIDITENETKRPKHSASAIGNETKITFDDPIQMTDYHCCSIRIVSKTFHQQTNSNLHGFNLQNIVVQNGVTFRFPEPICNKINLITRLLFDI